MKILTGHPSGKRWSEKPRLRWEDNVGKGYIGYFVLGIVKERSETLTDDGRKLRRSSLGLGRGAIEEGEKVVKTSQYSL